MHGEVKQIPRSHSGRYRPQWAEIPQGRAMAWLVVACLAARLASGPLSAVAQQTPSPKPAAPSSSAARDGSSWIEGFAKWHADEAAELVDLYRWLHEHPELSLQEGATAERLGSAWTKLGLKVAQGVGGHGVVGVLENGPGPTVMVRADLDALPVTERTQLPYASQVTTTLADGTPSGVMHACGHDLHMTCVTGTAAYLAKHREQWSGTLVVIGQPAEEWGQGATAMLKDGLLERFPRADYALALHVDPMLVTGKIGVRPGPMFANVDTVDITVRGRGGHGAAPHTTIDPVVQAAELVLSLQAIVSREVKPTQPAVVTVGSIHGGTKHNIIGDTCHLQLTVRSHSPAVRQQLVDAIRRRAEGVAAAWNAPKPTITMDEGTPSLHNDVKLATRLRGVWDRQLEGRVVDAELAMAGEDFSEYGLAGVPILMIRLGVTSEARQRHFEMLGQSPPSLHSAEFYPDLDRSLETGVAALVSGCLDLLPPAAR